MSGISKSATREATGPRNYLVALAWAIGGTLLGAALILGGGDRTVARPADARLVAAPATNPAATPARQTKSIEDIREGDLVLARDERTGQLAPKRVVETYIRQSDHLRILQIRSSGGDQVQELRTTDEHPFWVPGAGWVEAGKLRSGQRLLQADGQTAVVVTTQREDHAEGVPVYNFQVEDAHTYFVSQRDPDSAVLVHNDCYQRASQLLQANGGRGQILKFEAKGNLPYLGYNNELWQNHAIYISADKRVYDIHNNGTPFKEWLSAYMRNNNFDSVPEMNDFIKFSPWSPD